MRDIISKQNQVLPPPIFLPTHILEPLTFSKYRRRALALSLVPTARGSMQASLAGELETGCLPSVCWSVLSYWTGPKAPDCPRKLSACSQWLWGKSWPSLPLTKCGSQGLWREEKKTVVQAAFQKLGLAALKPIFLFLFPVSSSQLIRSSEERRMCLVSMPSIPYNLKEVLYCFFLKSVELQNIETYFYLCTHNQSLWVSL